MNVWINKEYHLRKDKCCSTSAPSTTQANEWGGASECVCVRAWVCVLYTMNNFNLEMQYLTHVKQIILSSEQGHATSLLKQRSQHLQIEHELLGLWGLQRKTLIDVGRSLHRLPNKSWDDCFLSHYISILAHCSVFHFLVTCLLYST